MLRRVGVGLILVLFLVGGLAFRASAAASGFSADVFTSQGKDALQGKIYFAKERARFETAGMVRITRMDKNVVWLLMPTEKMYMEQGIRLENLLAGAEAVPGEIERTLLGTETVNGYLTNKYRIVVQNEGRRQAMLQWLMVDGMLPVKTASEDGKWWQEFRNIKLGAPDDEMFEIPAGYKKFSMSM